MGMGMEDVEDDVVCSNTKLEEAAALLLEQPLGAGVTASELGLGEEAQLVGGNNSSSKPLVGGG